MKIVYGFLIGATAGGLVCGSVAGFIWILPRIVGWLGEGLSLVVLVMLLFGAIGANCAIEKPFND